LFIRILFRFSFDRDNRIRRTQAIKEWARNNLPVSPPIFRQSWPVLPSQKLEIERLFLHFCSLRTNEDKPNLGAKQGSYYMPIPSVSRYVLSVLPRRVSKRWIDTLSSLSYFWR